MQNKFDQRMKVCFFKKRKKKGTALIYIAYEEIAGSLKSLTVTKYQRTIILAVANLYHLFGMY